MLLSTLVLIFLKRKKNILFDKHRYVLISSDFKLKAKHSTTYCTFVLQESFDVYFGNNSSMFLVLLHTPRAFEWVQYVSLFR